MALSWEWNHQYVWRRVGAAALNCHGGLGLGKERNGIQVELEDDSSSI